ncbi:Protein kinase domain-containing protein [Talaromyces stipitatus ATCC 10500]|uniref:Protein kinase domain-containing protein n=1 Tax=Talaromyces stipitatus (strain ATCC 10500 / CBS 375.48 / QM 6759 / NRRL 1006) TaxID=441959 RepID=B8M3Z2_TALSN|nr:Protein kinase domain-containing protein [Talaromyces stipitatus ATCC 10500]EED20735.1 Protein kinase domain-containing protein [Talaromyces stipitatus ATCC 10500]
MAITIRDNSTGSSHRGFFNPPRDHELETRSESVSLPPTVPKVSMWHRLGFGRWLHRDEHTSGSTSPTNDHRENISRRLSRKVGAVGLPRPATFRRQNSERRDRLAPIESEHRRTQSADRRRPLSIPRTESPAPINVARLSAPEVGSWSEQLSALAHRDDGSAHEFLPETATLSHVDSTPYNRYDNASIQQEPVDDALEQELERKWILNLSMHFRDKSEREKFFVTYAEKPNRWRRVTVSCDYRNAPPDSLEQDLKELHYQRDKSARIYESIRDSLPEIQFYDTVTNLKLETSDGRLHVHVTEDVNETIPYPPVSSVRHLGSRLIPERDLMFNSHLSGFVYKVQLDGKAYIKKEIPGPDTVDEFLYEINALHALYGSQSVIQFEGIIVDDRLERVKGLLISYAEQGALVDVLYDFRGQLPLARRERWARQIVQGLCEIHEAGYVQGDFTLSNIVIDGDDNAKIIDINRRGCPVGWEPPEIAAKIESNQRISMYIGVKSDLFQLGMTLWALAMQEDEPERQPRPLFIPIDMKIPDYYRRVIAHCLSDRPRDRLSAKELLAMFPSDMKDHEHPVHAVPLPWRAYNSPNGPPFYDSLQHDVPQSVCLDGDHHEHAKHPSVVYVTPAEYESESDFPEIDFPPRGRRPSTHGLPPSDYQPSTYIPSSASPNPDGRRSISQSDFEVNTRPSPAMLAEPRFEEVEVNGTQYLVNPEMFTPEDLEALRDNTHEPHDSQELESGRNSDINRAMVPSSVCEGGKDADVDRDVTVQSHGAKIENHEDTGNRQNKSVVEDIAAMGSHSSAPLKHEHTQPTRSLENQIIEPSPASQTSTVPAPQISAPEPTQETWTKESATYISPGLGNTIPQDRSLINEKTKLTVLFNAPDQPGPYPANSITTNTDTIKKEFSFWFIITHKPGIGTASTVTTNIKTKFSFWLKVANKSGPSTDSVSNIKVRQE